MKNKEKIYKIDESSIQEYMKLELEELEGLVENPNEIETGCEPSEIDVCQEAELELIKEAIRRKVMTTKELKIRKGQKCYLCKKEIKKSWCYSGHWWHIGCKIKDSNKRIKKYLEDNEKTKLDKKRI